MHDLRDPAKPTHIAILIPGVVGVSRFGQTKIL